MLTSSQIVTIQALADREFTLNASIAEEEGTSNHFYNALKALLDTTNEVNKDEIENEVGSIIYNTIKNPQLVLPGLQAQDAPLATLLFKLKLISCLLYEKSKDLSENQSQRKLDDIDLNWIQDLLPGFEEDYKKIQFPPLSWTAQPMISSGRTHFDILLVALVAMLAYYSRIDTAPRLEEAIFKSAATAILVDLTLTLATVPLNNLLLNRDRLSSPQAFFLAKPLRQNQEVELLLKTIQQQIQDIKLPDAKASPRLSPSHDN